MHHDEVMQLKAATMPVNTRHLSHQDLAKTGMTVLFVSTL